MASTGFSKELHSAPQATAVPEYGFDGIEDDAGDGYHNHLGSTIADRSEMRRMGKKEELRRNFKPLSTLAFTVILQGTWEVLLAASTQGLYDGGLAGLFWSYIWTFVGMTLVNVSLAEMASMAPTSGGQYHWVSEFAPPKYQRFLSYFTGWQSTLSWQAGTASGPFLVGTMIQGLVTENQTQYSPTNWQGTLIVWVITLLVYFINVYGAQMMPIIQNMMLVLHCMAFLAFIVVFWVLSPHNTAEVVFTSFYNGGAWSSMGVCLMIGQISAVYGLICSDAAAHMSEETRDASVSVPRAMVGSYILNSALGLVFLVSYLFCITDVDSAVNDATGYPFLWVLRNFLALPGVNVMAALVIILIFAGTLSYNLSTSRQTWAFARDHGLPFSNWIAKVDPKRQMPSNSVAFTCIITFLLSLINLGSSTAFNAIISLNLVSLMITYTISIGCVLYRRVYNPELLPTARWSLGRMGVPINLAAFLYSTFVFFWCFWPSDQETTVEWFNWAVVMFVGVTIVSMVDYWVRARKIYTGPVVLVAGWKGE